MSNIVIISGSNNRNLEVANEFARYFSKQNVDSIVVDLISLDLPMYTPIEEEKGIPEKILEQKDLFNEALGFVFASPEYNGGVPPVVTNLIAWISRSGDENWRSVFNGKPAALATFSGSGGVQLLMSLRMQLSYLGMNTIGRQVRATYKEDLRIKDIEAVGQLLLADVK